MKKDRNIKPWELDKCPITGLPITRKPEWVNVTFDAEFYKITCSLIGRNIILVKTWGHADLRVTRKYFSFMEKIVKEVIPEGEKYVLIEDYSDHEYATYKAKTCYINCQKKNERIKALIFYGTSLLFQIMIKIGKRISKRAAPIKVVPDYESAILMAREYSSKTIDKDDPEKTMIGEDMEPELFKEAEKETRSAVPVSEIKENINNTLKILRDINWDSEGFNLDRKNIDNLGLFTPLIESISLIKKDLDTIFVERNKAENGLKDSEERLRILFEYAPDAYYLNDLKGTFIDGNKMAEEITGYKKEELIGKNFLKLKILPADQIPKAAKLLTENVLGKPTGPDEFIMNRKDGSQITVEIRTFPVKIKGKSLVMGIARDITGRKESEREKVQYTRDLEILSETAMKFVDFPEDEDIYKFIGEQLSKLVNNAYIIVNSFDRETNKILNRAFLFGKHTRNIYKLLGKKVVGMSFTISEEALQGLTSGRLIKVPGGIYELSLGEMPKAMCSAAEKIAGTGTIYTMGFTEKGVLYGNAVAVMYKGIELKNKDTVEIFMRQAGVALQRRYAEEREKQYNQNLGYLSRTAIDFVAFPPEKNIYEYIGERLREIAGDSIVLVGSFDENTKLIQFHSVVGWGKLQDLVLKLLGRSPVGMTFPILEEEDRSFRTGRLIKMSRSMYELVQGKIPEAACNKIVKLVGIGDIYSFGIAREGMLFAVASILMRRGTEIRDVTTIETFVNQASVALQRSKAQGALRDSEGKSKTLVENLPQKIFFKDKNLVYISCNKNYAQDLKIKPDEIFGRTDYDFYPRELAEKYRADDKRIIKLGELEDLEEGYIRNGKKTWVHTIKTPVRDDKGDILGVLGIFWDITEHKLAGEKLKESEKRYQALFDKASIGIGMATLDGKIIAANQIMQDTTGYTLGELESINLENTYVDPSGRKRLMKLLKESGKVRDFEIKLKRKNGSVYDASLNLDIIEIGEEKLILTTATDITQRKQTEEEREKLQTQFIQAQKMEAIGTLAGGVAHDFNNLLTVIEGYTNLAMSEIDKTSPVYSDLKEVYEAGVRASELTRQLLIFSRKQPVEITPTDINNLINNLLKMLKRIIGENISVITKLEHDSWMVKADKTRIEQVVMNLAVNAHDAMLNGGKLTLKTENVIIDEEYKGRFPEAYPGKFVCLSVQDTGVGMDKEVIQHIFEPFFTTKEKGKGTGLGLPVVYGVVKQHNGWINIYSEPGKGTIFKIYLPASLEKKEDTTEKKVPMQTLQGRGERVLLVEDEESIRRFSIKVLVMNGYSVFEAGTVREALDIFRKEKGNFDLLFTDVVLPDRSSLELIDELLYQKPELCVLVTSGYTDSKSHGMEIREKGFRFLQKPYEPNGLLTAVRETLNKRK